jgi:hypothetical protein
LTHLQRDEYPTVRSFSIDLQGGHSQASKDAITQPNGDNPKRLLPNDLESKCRTSRLLTDFTDLQENNHLIVQRLAIDLQGEYGVTSRKAVNEVPGRRVVDGPREK